MNISQNYATFHASIKVQGQKYKFLSMLLMSQTGIKLNE